MATPKLLRKCSECSTDLGADALPTKKTCSDRCRGLRSRRIAREKKARRHPTAHTDAAAALAAMAPAQPGAMPAMPDLAGEVMREELRPVVREAMTDDVLRGIQRLVSMSDRVATAIWEDLHSSDESIRQKAYTVWLRYTVGHPALVQGEKDTAGNFTVIFDGMVRPDATAQVDGEAVELPDEPPRTCNGCNQEKPADQFEGRSDRCLVCHEALRERARAILSPPA